MVELAEIQAAYYMVAATGVLVAAIFYILNLRISQRNQELMLKAQQQTLETRQAQMFMSIYQTDYSNDFQEAVHRVMEMEIKDADDWKKMRRDKEMYKAWTMVGSYLEGIGVLVRENLVDIRLVSELMSGFIRWYWEHFGSGILRCREELNWPRFFIEVEYLAERVRDFGREHPELGIVSPDFAAHVTSPGPRANGCS
ncbi:MAG: hypothetical protein OEZ44_06380 [Candidatus Bathyarchaeota archaeon]|nr:hypothetical protein [Candidatus Bathyarchaeota archaeon]